MAVFRYRAQDREGRMRRGQHEADSPAAVRAWVRAQGWLPLEVHAVSDRRSGGGLWRPRLPVDELVMFLTQLHTLLDSGTPLGDALCLLMGQAESRHQHRLAATLYEQVQAGTPLAQALREAPYSLPAELIAAVRAGEESGHLAQVLGQMAALFEQRAETRRGLQGAMVYPLLMLLFSLAVVAFLMGYVVPKIVTVFDSLHQTLPPLTRALIALSDFVREHGGALLSLVILTGMGLAWAWQRPGGRSWLQRFGLRLPLWGRLMRERAVALWAQTLGMLLAAGVPIVPALRIARESVPLLPMQGALADLPDQVSRGMPLSQALRQSGFFPPLLLHLVNSGEHNAQLPALLQKAATYYARRYRQRMQAMTALLEPLMIIIMGGVVLLIVLAIMVPIFSMNQMVHL